MHKTTASPRTLLLASMQLPSARQLASAATKRGTRVCILDESTSAEITGDRTFYGGSDRAMEYALKYELCLIEPPLDLIAKVPAPLLGRQVRFGTLGELSHLAGPIFVKPADPILKCFDPGVYRSVSEVQGRRPLDRSTPILVASPVEWTSEYRCFIKDGRLETWSPYLSFGRPIWKAGMTGDPPASLRTFVDRLTDQMRQELPPAYVVDIGVLDDGRWAVVEFNPAWCSGILGANVEAVLRVVERAARWNRFAKDDRKWSRARPPQIAAG